MALDQFQDAHAARIADAQTMAIDLGFVLVNSNDARNGRFRIQRGRDYLHHADDIEDAIGFLQAWGEHVH